MSNTSKGYVYILTNPAQQGLVKIGKTTKAPEERVKELSSATGVAAPFALIYHRQFNNCHIAEKTAHQILEDKRFRFNDSREFFTIPINDAIHLIQSIKDEEKEIESEEFDDDEKQITENVGELYYVKGLNYYNGNNGCFEDADKALDHFIKAADCGYIEAHQYIGRIYQYDKKGTVHKAIQAYQEGAKFGNTECCTQLGIIYAEDKDYKNDKNAELAWEYFFTNLKIEKATDREIFSIGYCLFHKFLNKKPINEKWLSIIKPLRNRTVHLIYSSENHYRDRILGLIYSSESDQWFAAYTAYHEAVDYLNLIDDANDEQEDRDYFNYTIKEDGSIEDFGEFYYSQGHGLYHFDYNYRKALKYFIKAANNGYTMAYQDIGKIYYYDEKGLVHKAIQAFREGAKLGDAVCCAELGIIYTIDDSYKNENNAKLAWDFFFTSLNLEKITYREVWGIRDYLFYTLSYKKPIEQKWLPIIKTAKDSILDHMRQLMNSESRIMYSEVEKYLQSIDLDSSNQNNPVRDYRSVENTRN